MRLQYMHNKKTFSHRGVIFEIEDGWIKICHIPLCGMDYKTAFLLSQWLAKRACEMERKDALKAAKEVRKLFVGKQK